MKQQILELADTLDRMPITGSSWEVAEQISAVNGMLRLAEMLPCQAGRQARAR